MAVSLGEHDPGRKLINPFTAMPQAPRRHTLAPPVAVAEAAPASAALPISASAAPAPATARAPHLLRVPRRLTRAAHSGLIHLVDTLYDWHERSRQRRFLSGMDDALLRDIGYSRADADAEARKPFWRP